MTSHDGDINECSWCGYALSQNDKVRAEMLSLDTVAMASNLKVSKDSNCSLATPVG